MRSDFFMVLLSALLLSLGWPTYGEPLLLFVAFIPLLIVEHRVRRFGSSKKGLRVFLLSYFTFLVWNIWTTWWLCKASLFGGAFTLIANSFLMAGVFYSYHWISKRHNSKLSLVFLISIFLSFEKFHLNWELSWPWLNIGNAFSDRVTWIQWYEYTGVFGGTLWVLLVNIYLFKAIICFQIDKNKRLLLQKVSKATLIIVIPICISLIMYTNYQEKSNPIKTLLLQPNFDPYEEKYEMNNLQVYDSLFSLFNIDTLSSNLIIAPETVFPNHIERRRLDDSYLVKSIRKILYNKHPKLSFLSGVSLFEKKNISDRHSIILKDKIINIYNSAFILNKNQKSKIYNKSKPVAGVEIFPYKNILEPIGSLVINLGGVSGDITPQRERDVFYNVDGTTAIGPIICYESVFGEFVTGYVKKGAQIFAVITNDGWWDNTQGHKQLLSYTRLRAIENRRSIARSANTGVSSFINQRGDIIRRLGYNVQGALEGIINSNDQITFYTHYGDIIARLGMFLSVILFLTALTKRRKKL